MTPIAAKDGMTSRNALPAFTEDEFHRGRFRVLQPRDNGHRSGSDAMLIAAGIEEGARGSLADLGAGAGVAGLAVLASNPGIEALLVERNTCMADLARASLKLAANRAFAYRARVLEADLCLTGSKRRDAGLEENAFDFAIMNPPYNHDGQRASPDGLRAEAHVLGALGLEPWMRTAAAILRPGGALVMIYRTERIGELIACSQGRFGGLSIIPVHARADSSAGRILVRMVKGSRAPLQVRPGIVMHGDNGEPTAMAAALVKGEARIDFG